MSNGCLTVVCLLALICSVQALDGQFFPIERELLYKDYRGKIDPECWDPANSTVAGWKKCVDDNAISVDYTCRYSVHNYDCYCCGAFFHYIEQGKVCTKYCLTSQETTFCQLRLIILPFNWGDVYPEKITLDSRKSSSNVNRYSEQAQAQREESRRSRNRPDKEVKFNPFTPSSDCPRNPINPDLRLGPPPITTPTASWLRPNPNPTTELNSFRARVTSTTRPKEENPAWGQTETGTRPTTKTTTTSKPMWGRRQETSLGDGPSSSPLIQPHPQARPEREKFQNSRKPTTINTSTTRRSSTRRQSPRPTTIQTTRFGLGGSQVILVGDSGRPKVQLNTVPSTNYVTTEHTGEVKDPRNWGARTSDRPSRPNSRRQSNRPSKYQGQSSDEVTDSAPVWG